MLQISKMNEPQNGAGNTAAALTTPRYKEQGMAELQPILAQAALQPSPTTEEWRPIAEMKGRYEVSSFGRVRSIYGICRELPLARVGQRVILKCGRNGLKRRVHELVYKTFRGDVPAGREILHADGNKANNALANLVLTEPIVLRARDGGSQSLLDRISGRVVVVASGCWEWQGSRNAKGYGKLSTGASRLEQALEYVHRVVYRESVGDVNAETVICHKCDNPPCCNPAHLFAGTTSDNVRDCVAKNRFRPPALAGEDNGRAQLTAEIVKQVRAKHPSGTISGEAAIYLATEHGVTPSCIRKIVYRRTWKGVE